MQPYHNRKLTDSGTQATLEKIERLHPHKMLLYLAIFGSMLIFLFMLIAFTATYNHPIMQEGGAPALTIPKAFIFSTLVLMLSSYYVSRFQRAFEQENMKKLRNMLGITVMLGFVFTISQYWGWHQLEQAGHGLSGISSGAYLYIISGLHILHLVGAMFFMTHQFIHISGIATDPVKTLITVTNPYQKLKLEMLTTYWHFMDGLWVALFLYFLFWF
jgi:cytochrome c oxidase subunit III